MDGARCFVIDIRMPERIDRVPVAIERLPTQVCALEHASFVIGLDIADFQQLSKVRRKSAFVESIDLNRCADVHQSHLERGLAGCSHHRTVIGEQRQCQTGNNQTNKRRVKRPTIDPLNLSRLP